MSANNKPRVVKVNAQDMDSYNTQKPDVILKEYGRNIQKIVDYIVKIEDDEERNRYAHNLIELMRQINPNTRDSQDYQNKLWDDLYIMSRFNLEVDSPYPLPEKTMLGKKPKRLEYSTHKITYKHYGRNVELLLEKALEIEDSEDQYSALVHIGRLMKSFYLSWNKDNIQDSLIVDHMERISGKTIEQNLKDRLMKENPFDTNSPKEKSNNSNKSSGKKSKKKKKS